MPRKVGDESVVIGKVTQDVGNKSVVIGATDDRGNTIINTPMAVDTELKLVPVQSRSEPRYDRISIN